MTTEVFAEYTGLTADAVALIERFRREPTESKSEILVRVLSPLVPVKTGEDDQPGKLIDYKEGIKLRVGEKLYLFLSKEAKDKNRPDGLAELKEDGFYFEGRKLAPLGKRAFQPAMRMAQERARHFDSDGKPVSLSALRQWHVLREGTLKPLVELKDPELARTRGRHFGADIDLDLSSLGL